MGGWRWEAGCSRLGVAGAPLHEWPGGLVHRGEQACELVVLAPGAEASKYIAVLWSCQRIDVCDSVRLLYLLPYLLKRGRR